MRPKRRTVVFVFLLSLCIPTVNGDELVRRRKEEPEQEKIVERSEEDDDKLMEEEETLLDAVVTHNVQELIEEEEEEEEALDDDDAGAFTGQPSPIYQKSPSEHFLLPWISAVGLIGMIFTAWQMADHPDGIWATLCRWILDIIRFVIYILTTPCRKCCHNEPYGRISTMEYGYAKNPALELS